MKKAKLLKVQVRSEPLCGCNWDYGECHHALPKPPCGNVGTHFYFQPNPTTGEIMKLPLCDQCWRTQLSLQRLSPEEEEALVTQYTRDMMAKEEPGAA